MTNKIHKTHFYHSSTKWYEAHKFHGPFYGAFWSLTASILIHFEHNLCVTQN